MRTSTPTPARHADAKRPTCSKCHPLQISKSNLTAVGSPHTWPSLLAAVTWIVELLVYQEKAEAARQVHGWARGPGRGGGSRGGVGWDRLQATA